MTVIWHDIVPAVGYLGRFTLWESGLATAGPVGEAVRITLAEPLLAVVWGTVTILACRNLPGLLDLAVYQRLPFDAGARYAATAVTQYAVAVIGTVLCFRQIGIGWQSVQWLVAAMTVGLGFGLQEIFGTLSLENNGGFASVRTKPTDLDIKTGDTLVIRVKGDGRQYVLNVYTKSRRRAFSYRAPLPTTQDEWTQVEIPLADFIPTAFGRRVQGMGPIEPSQINGLGFMLSDKKPGTFSMQVESIGVLRTDR